MGRTHHHHDRGAHSGAHAGHSHAPADFGLAFAVGIGLNTVFLVIEAAFGFATGSMALVADAGHNLSDVLALLLAWGANVAARRAPSDRFTYGFKSSTILAAIANALLLAVAIGAIGIETVRRLFEPAEPQGMVMVIVAGIGIAINAATAALFARGHGDLNIRGAYLHMAADALVSLGVVLGGVAILLTGNGWIDPLISAAILAVIAWGTWGLARDSLRMGLLGVPSGIDLEAVRAHLSGLEGVEGVHDLHIWPMSTSETAMTAHLVMPGAGPDDDFLGRVAAALRTRFSIQHSTIQIERGNGDGCALSDGTAACGASC
ncbi:MAG: cation diffusion facilitator family transporter [Erythrobacter sp.]|jgi:cobalt-zinc-cadmium efflux system protein|nr:cation diffusion facilitator family transporter [Erythrobacter sp.]